MADYNKIKSRTIEEGEYVRTTKATIRETAQKFNVSKSTVHVDLTERLPEFNLCLANAVRTVLDKNKDERHIRGGLATRKKYLER